MIESSSRSRKDPTNQQQLPNVRAVLRRVGRPDAPRPGRIRVANWRSSSLMLQVMKSWSGTALIDFVSTFGLWMSLDF